MNLFFFWSSLIITEKGLFNSFLVEESRDQAGGDGAAAFSDVESLTGFDGEGVVDLTHHFDVVAGLDHLVLWGFGAFGPVEMACLVF